MNTYDPSDNIGREHGGPPDPPVEPDEYDLAHDAICELRGIFHEWFRDGSDTSRRAHGALSTIGEYIYKLEDRDD